MLKDQPARTAAPQWVRVIGGWTEFQFAEGRMPTLDEINVVAPDTPVFVMHLYDRALLNGAALRAVGFDKNTPDFPAGEVQRDRQGNPTGLLIARPNANILYSTLAKGPKLSREDQLNSSRQFFRELNRFGQGSASCWNSSNHASKRTCNVNPAHSHKTNIMPLRLCQSTLLVA
jgi:predicted amidohydrolase YtcJ